MAGDASYANVVLLLHGEGANGSTTISDNAATQKTVTAVGNAAISTAQKKFGSSSIAFDGTGDYLTVPHSTDFSIQGGTFTIEAWVRRAASGAMHYVLSKRAAAATNGWEWRINADNTLQFFHTGGSSITSSGTVASGQWVHIACVRNGTTVTMYIDGTSSGSGTFTNGTENTADTLKIGCDNSFDNGFNGHMGDIRITKGVARYTSAFTPPSASFSNGLGEVAGVVRDSAGSLCSRVVRAYRRDTGALAGSATSDASTGAYLIATPTLDEVTVVALDNAVSGTYYNDQVVRVIPA